MKKSFIENQILLRLTREQVNKLSRHPEFPKNNYQIIELETVGEIVAFNIIRKAICLYSASEIETLLRISPNNEMLIDDGKTIPLPVNKFEYFSKDYLQKKFSSCFHQGEANSDKIKRVLKDMGIVV